MKGTPSVSHHFDSAADRADGRINPCDLYAFPATPGTTVLILTVNPDAGRSSPTTFRPDARYEFVVAAMVAPARTSLSASPSPSSRTTGGNGSRSSVPTAAPATARRGQPWARAAPARYSRSAGGWPGPGCRESLQW